VHVDDFITRNQEGWAHLGGLVERARRRRSRLSVDELDELILGYERASTHLSIARSRYQDPALVASLSRLVASAGALIYGTRPASLQAASRFVRDTFPAALWRIRWHVLASTALFVIPFVVIGLWVGVSPAALEASGPEALRQAYVEEDFEAYYSNLASGDFAALVTTNNIRVGALAFAGGVGLLPTALVLVYNGVGVGVAWGLFIAAGEQARFWGLILPHGLLELTAVFIAGGAGLALGWALVDPGDRRRAAALAEEGRRAVVVVVGLIAVFTFAGLIEGFVTGQPWPTWLRVGIGATSTGIFLLYVWVRGRDATARGLTGALGEQSDAGWTRVAAG
jgi:uncharacterized membrane protein SpoIIM required for sporulation